MTPKKQWSNNFFRAFQTIWKDLSAEKLTPRKQKENHLNNKKHVHFVWVVQNLSFQGRYVVAAAAVVAVVVATAVVCPHPCYKVDTF